MSGEEEVIEVTIDMAELKKMKVPELKKKLAELGLSVKGTKAELLARVEKYIHEQEDLLVEEEEVEEEEEEGEEEDEDEVQQEEEVQQGGQEEQVAAVTQKEEEELKPAEEKVSNNATPVDTAPNQKAAVETVPPVTKINTTVASNQADRLAQRAARFGGNSSDEAKKMARAERFGTSLENGYQGLGKRGPVSEAEMEKIKKRQERFGVAVSPAITSLEDAEKKKKRLERFGQSVTELGVEERKKARAARFSNS